MSLKTKSCRCCRGSGKELDQKAVAAEMKKYRMTRVPKPSQATIAKRMGITPAYLCDLEQGYRNWNPSLIQRFKKACDQ